MIKKNSLRDQFMNKNLYDILVHWNNVIVYEVHTPTCLVEIIFQDKLETCPYNTENCEKCIEHLMNEIVPSQTGQRP